MLVSCKNIKPFQQATYHPNWTIGHNGFSFKLKRNVTHNSCIKSMKSAHYMYDSIDRQCTLMVFGWWVENFNLVKQQQKLIWHVLVLQAVVLFVGSKGFSNERYELIAQFPHRQLSQLDYDATLRDIGLHSQETIFVQTRTWSSQNIVYQ